MDIGGVALDEEGDGKEFSGGIVCESIRRVSWSWCVLFQSGIKDGL